MTEAKGPMAEANRISKMLNMVLGPERFPVKVDELAQEYSRQCFADSPIDKVQGEDLDGFDGLLKANKSRSKWLILYNSAVRSEGRKRFTIAHEFGHSNAVTMTLRLVIATRTTLKPTQICLLQRC